MSKWQTSSEFFNKLAATSWHTRNDSSNIAGVLKTEQRSITNTLSYRENRSDGVSIPLVVSNECYTEFDNPSKCSCSHCYCNKSPIRPKIAKKLESQHERQQKLNPGKRKMLNRINRCSGYVYNSARERYIPCDYLQKFVFDENTFRPNENCSHDLSSLHFTTPRQVYENFKSTDEFEKEYRDILDNCVDRPNNKFLPKETDKAIQVETSFKEKPEACGIPPCCSFKSFDKFELPQTQEKSTTTNANHHNITFLDSLMDTDKNLKRLNTFRKENYFDTHSASVKDKSKIPEHKCVHKFVLDDRLYPQPLNPDLYGRSSCIICYKPMQAGVPTVQDSNTQLKITLSSNSQVDEDEYKSANEKIRSDTKSSRHPKPVIKPNKIEITVPLNLHNNFKIKKPTATASYMSTNSLALRHQKGIIK